MPLHDVSEITRMQKLNGIAQQPHHGGIPVLKASKWALNTSRKMSEGAPPIQNSSIDESYADSPNRLYRNHNISRIGKDNAMHQKTRSKTSMFA